MTAHKNSIKIREFTDIHKHEFKKRLTALIFNLGVQNVSEVEINAVHLFILTNYKDFSMMEVFDSFDLGLTGHLGMEKKDMDHYQAFSNMYVSKFLNAYREYRSKKIIDSEVKKLEPVNEIPLEQSLKIAEESAKKRLIEFYKEFQKSKKYDFQDNNNIVYDMLDKMGLIEFDASRKKGFMEVAKTNCATEKLSNNPMQYKGLIQNALNDLSQKVIISEAKKIALKVWIKEQCEMEQDIELLINEVTN